MPEETKLCLYFCENEKISLLLVLVYARLLFSVEDNVKNTY
jgi:hypothetical protein